MVAVAGFQGVARCAIRLVEVCRRPEKQVVAEQTRGDASKQQLRNGPDDEV